MFGFSDIKKDLAVVLVVCLTLFGLYRYHQDLKNTITEQNKTIIALNVTIVERNTTIDALEGANKVLVEDVKQENEMCKVRLTELNSYYATEAEYKVTNVKKRTVANTKIETINKDPNKNVEQKLIEVLEIEYDILTGK